MESRPRLDPHLGPKPDKYLEPAPSFTSLPFRFAQA